jgi:hypothetical protein
MDINSLDQMFQLEKRHLQLEYVTYKRHQLVMHPDVEKWLVDNKIPYTFTRCGAAGVLHIHDRKWATMFKLSWM